MNTVAILALSITATPEPPAAFRILRKGPNKTTKGTVSFDEQSQGTVIAAYAQHGTDLLIDYEHRSILTAGAPVDGGKAAGWFKPEVRDGELWASDVQWTPAAAMALKAREYRYFSPALLHDKSGRVHRLVNVALTNLPATQHLQPLMASALASPDAPDMPLAVSSDEFKRAYDNTRAALAAPSTIHAGTFSQKAVSYMPPEKEQQLTLLSSVMEITTADRTAALTLSANELELCRWFKTSPASFLATKREQQSA